MAVVFLKDVATEEYNTVISSEMRVYIVPVSELAPQYKHRVFFWGGRGGVMFAFDEHCRQRRLPGVSAEHGITVQTVVETKILKYIYMYRQLKSPVRVFQLRYMNMRVSLVYLQQKVVK